ncbi:hypothetical protein [Nocardioides salarius]|uniref:hypothetical protein n=1 Tax=Nocardioides salarius TaxID=374513 RepID=UPI0030F9A806
MTETKPRNNRPPLEFVGAVRILNPCSKGYFRLKWTEPDGKPGDTSGGKTLETARTRATRENQRLSLAVGPLAVTSLRNMVDRFIAEGTSPYPHKKTQKLEQWKPTQKENLRKALERCLHNHEHYRAMDLDLDRKLVDAMRAQGGTYAVVRSNTSALRAFLTWAGKKKYISWRQAEMLPRGALMPEPVFPRVSVLIERADSPARLRQNGAHLSYVREEDAPSAEQVVRLRREMAELVPSWGDLAPEFAANTGARWGEQFQLTANDICLEGCADDPSAHAHVLWQVNPAGTAAANDRRCAPKGDKSRRIPITIESFTGYPLREGLRHRVEQARGEREAGTNPEALIFPSARGGLLWYTAFVADLLLPAMEAAGWPIDVYEDTWHQWDGEKFVGRTSRRRNARLPWHSLRHRFARICVDVKKLREGVLMAVGGWENIATVQNRYYRSGDDAMNEGTAAFD